MEEKNEKSLLVSIVAIVIALFIALGAYFILEESKMSKNLRYQMSVLVNTCGKDSTKINDSTYHINLTDEMCVTFQKSNDTLNIDAVGVSWMECNLSNDDTIRIYCSYKNGEYYNGEKYRNGEYNINYHDYFDEDVKFVNFKVGKIFGNKSKEASSFVDV